MGEKKRRDENLTPQQRAARMITEVLADKGRLIEGGFAALAVTRFPTVSPHLLQILRLAYMAGAEHLFSSIMAILDEGDLETDQDMRRMDLIAKEIEVIRGELERDHATHKGQS